MYWGLTWSGACGRYVTLEELEVERVVEVVEGAELAVVLEDGVEVEQLKALLLVVVDEPLCEDGVLVV